MLRSPDLKWKYVDTGSFCGNKNQLCVGYQQIICSFVHLFICQILSYCLSLPYTVLNTEGPVGAKGHMFLACMGFLSQIIVHVTLTRWLICFFGKILNMI